MSRHSCLGWLVPFCCRRYTKGDQGGRQNRVESPGKRTPLSFSPGWYARPKVSGKRGETKRGMIKGAPSPDSERERGSAGTGGGEGENESSREELEGASCCRSITLLLLLRHHPPPSFPRLPRSPRHMLDVPFWNLVFKIEDRTREQARFPR